MGAMKEPAVSLYDADYYAWVHDQLGALRRGEFKRLDLGNLIEEIESLGRTEERELESRMEQILMHLLKWEHQPSKRGTSWMRSIREQRRRLERLFKRMPSLRSKVANFLPDDYKDAREAAADETGIELATFPVECPYSVEQVLQADWLPPDGKGPRRAGSFGG